MRVGRRRRRRRLKTLSRESPLPLKVLVVALCQQFEDQGCIGFEIHFSRKNENNVESRS